VRALHASLHGGRVGTAVVAVLGLALVGEGLTGLWLYGPVLRRRPRSRTLHRVLGGVSLAFAVVVGASGAALAAMAIAGATGVPESPAHSVLRRLHYGDFAGWPSRIAYAAAGVTLPLLAITGYVIVARRQG
jgi:uncharacterized iron-regulated membrane protein